VSSDKPRATNKPRPRSSNPAGESRPRSPRRAPISTGGILRDCLYFAANALARTITRLAEEEFRTTGLSPSHAYLLMLVLEQPGTTQKELGESLQLAPSTVTRLVDTLVHRGLVTRRSSGRSTTVTPTPRARQLLPSIEQAWWRLRDRYSDSLGAAAGEALTRRIGRAQAQLEK
jgi:DNA-binding MarR family transcriptional regulator